jgi:hypothetical protein
MLNVPAAHFKMLSEVSAETGNCFPHGFITPPIKFLKLNVMPQEALAPTEAVTRPVAHADLDAVALKNFSQFATGEKTTRSVWEFPGTPLLYTAHGRGSIRTPLPRSLFAHGGETRRLRGWTDPIN